MTEPFTFTFPFSVSVSALRRLQSPADAMYLFKRIPSRSFRTYSPEQAPHRPRDPAAKAFRPAA
jgi:hypothetical protein